VVDDHTGALHGSIVGIKPRQKYGINDRNGYENDENRWVASHMLQFIDRALP
jgi:hypothetical protein